MGWAGPLPAGDLLHQLWALWYPCPPGAEVPGAINSVLPPDEITCPAPRAAAGLETEACCPSAIFSMDFTRAKPTAPPGGPVIETRVHTCRAIGQLHRTEVWFFRVCFWEFFFTNPAINLQGKAGPFSPSRPVARADWHAPCPPVPSGQKTMPTGPHTHEGP